MEAIRESLRGFGHALKVLCRPELLFWAFISTIGVYTTSVLSTKSNMNLNSDGIHAFSALIWILSFSFTTLVCAQSIANHQMDSIEEAGVNQDAFKELIAEDDKFEQQEKETVVVV